MVQQKEVFISKNTLGRYVFLKKGIGRLQCFH
jgi:hypothetical protein